jgi:hypothetical protein
MGPSHIFVICFASFQDTFCSCSSTKTFLFQLTLGLPFPCFPYGFQSSPCLFMLFWSFLKVCPIHFHFLILISLLIGICCVVSHNSLLLIVFGRHILNMLQRHRLTKDCNFLMISYVAFQASNLYNSTLITLLLNILSFVLLSIWCDEMLYVIWVTVYLEKQCGITAADIKYNSTSW